MKKTKKETTNISKKKKMREFLSIISTFPYQKVRKKQQLHKNIKTSKLLQILKGFLAKLNLSPLNERKVMKKKKVIIVF